MTSQAKATLPPSERIPPNLLATDDGKFKPKLDVLNRYRALAAVRSGIKKEIVAAAFGIDRRTISHMTNPQSKHYKSTREKELSMGTKAFVQEYFDEWTLQKILLTDLSKIQPSGSVSQDDGTPKPNPRAKSKAGINVVKPEQCKYNHRVDVKFFEAGKGQHQEGWWYRDMDGPNPDEWCRGDDGSLMTSQDCLRAAEESIYDA